MNMEYTTESPSLPLVSYPQQPTPKSEFDVWDVFVNLATAINIK